MKCENDENIIDEMTQLFQSKVMSNLMITCIAYYCSHSS